MIHGTLGADMLCRRLVPRGETESVQAGRAAYHLLFHGNFEIESQDLFILSLLHDSIIHPTTAANSSGTTSYVPPQNFTTMFICIGF